MGRRRRGGVAGITEKGVAVIITMECREVRSGAELHRRKHVLNAFVGLTNQEARLSEKDTTSPRRAYPV